LPIREFSTGGGNFVFVDAPLTSTEVWNLERIKAPFRRHTWSCGSTRPVPRSATLHLGRTQVYFGDFIFWGGKSYGQEGCHDHIGKRAPLRPQGSIRRQEIFPWRPSLE
jgi:hypothetical protein